ncbi:Spindle and kinetochore-associated protein 1 [Balamuthia mandrillaris]
MNHVRNHRPNNLPGPKPGPMVHPSLTLEEEEDHATQGDEEEYDEQEPECNSNERRREHGQSKSSSSTERRGGEGAHTRGATATNRKQQRGSNVHASSAQQPRRRVQGPKYVVPTISHITKEELDATPKYMKGRATVAKINAAIDDIQALVAKKYRLLSMPANKVGSRNLKKYQGFVDLQRQCTDKEDNIFFTEEDLREAANLRLDTTGKSILAVLRHLGRLKEKGGRTKRFTLMPVQPLSDVTNAPL